MSHMSIAPLTRRRFLAAAGATALAAPMHTLADADRHDTRFAYTASDHEIRVYSTLTTPWTVIQSLPSEAPISLVVDSGKHALHALHGVAEFEGLPRGYVESFRIDRRTGRLAPLHRQPLSLSAIHPRHMALSPDGNTLAVAVDGGSAYNLLPILQDGRPGRPFAIRKETGISPSSPADPIQAAFNAASDRIFALDPGLGAVSILAAEPELPALFRFSLPSGGRPSFLALYPEANLLFVTDQKSGSLLMLQHDPSTSTLSLASKPAGTGFQEPLAVHGPSRTIFTTTANSIRTFRIDVATGTLQHAQELLFSQPDPGIRSLMLDPQYDALYATGEKGIWRTTVDFQRESLSRPALVAPAAQSIALL